jgi:hypothetical protein
MNDAFDLVLAIADGSVRDVRETAERLRTWQSNLDAAG